MTFRQTVIYFGSIGLATTILVTSITAWRQHQGQGAREAAASKTEIRKQQTKSGRKIAWKSSFEAAMKEAKSSGKPIMIDFYADWCGWCKKLDAEVYPDSAVVAEADNFVNVKVDAEKRTDLTEKYHVEGLPTVIWLRPDGTVIDRLPAYMDAGDFAQMMRSASSSFGSAAV